MQVWLGRGLALPGPRNLDAVGATFATVDRAGEQFAAAAVDPTRWINAMDHVAVATGSVGALLLPIRGAIPHVPFSASIGGLVESYFGEGWVQREERARGIPAMMRRGVFTDLDFISDDEIARHPYYQDFLGRHGLRWCGVVKMSFGDDLWCLSIQRSIRQGPFSPSEVNQLAGLSESLAAAGALARALGFARAESALAAFDASGMAVALLDRFGQVFRLNAAAERLLSNDPKIVQRRIRSRNHQATAALDRALHSLLWARPDSALMPPVALPREGKRPLIAYPLRPPAICADALAACQAVVVLIDPDTRAQAPEAHLRIAFNLTPAEARLAARLALGERLEDAADALGITYQTARSELKRIFVRLGVTRQSELVALLARLVIR